MKSENPEIFIIEDDENMQDCIALACAEHPYATFTNVIDAINAIDDHQPKLIFLDVLLDGPDGFTFLNEIASYSDLSQIPVVIITSLNIAGENLANYGVVAVLDKSTMTPKEIRSYVRKYC